MAMAICKKKPKKSAGGGGGERLLRPRQRDEGRRRKIKLKATYTWQMINGVGRSLFFFFYGVFVRFSILNKGSSKTPLKTFWGNTCPKLLAEKVERKKTFFLSSFPIDFSFIAFLAVSLHEEPKNTIKMLSKIGPENLKKSQKR
jgi:hypothetical protein